MTIGTIANGESGSSVRSKLNGVIGLVNAFDAASLDSRIGEIENDTTIYQVFQSVISGTSGTVTKPEGSTIILNKYEAGIDAIITGMSSGVPTDSPIYSDSGSIITCTFDISGNYVLSGTPSSYPVGLVYFISISALKYQDMDKNIIIDRFDTSKADEVHIAYGADTTSMRTVQDAFNTYHPSGSISGFTYTTNSSGDMFFSAGECELKTTDSYSGESIVLKVEATTIHLDDGDNRYIYVDYNGGSPILTSTINPITITFTNQVPIGFANRIGTYINFADGRAVFVGGMAKLAQKTLGAYNVEHMDGTGIYLPLTASYTPGGLYIYVSEGRNYVFVNAINHRNFNTLTGDTFYEVYDSGTPGVYNRDFGKTSLCNTKYSDGSGTLQTMTDGYYNIHIIYITIDNTNPRLIVWRPNGQFKTPAEALAWQLPGYAPAIGLFRPPECIPWGGSILVSKVIVQKGSNYIFGSQEVRLKAFVNTEPIEHDGLKNIDNGEIKHLTPEQLAALHTQNTDSGTTSNLFAIGDTTSVGDKRIVAAINSSDRPEIKYEISSNSWKLSNNGVDFYPIGTEGAVSADNVTETSTRVFVTPAQKTVISNTSNTNTGDETVSTIKSKLGAATSSSDGYATSTQITKLDGIAAGAEVNVNADWNASSGDSQILNKPTIPADVSSKKYIIQTADASLPNAQSLGALSTGLLKNTTTTGVLSIASAGTDYQAPLGFTAENSSNKETSALDTSTTKYPCNNVVKNAVDAKLTNNMTTGKLLGRNTASNGVVEEISLGTGLSFSGTTLNSAAGDTTVSAVTSSTSHTINWENGNLQILTLAHSPVTLSFTAPSTSKRLFLVLIQDATGNRAIKFPAITFDMNIPPILDAAPTKTTLINLYYNGLSYVCFDQYRLEFEKFNSLYSASTSLNHGLQGAAISSGTTAIITAESGFGVSKIHNGIARISSSTSSNSGYIYSSYGATSSNAIMHRVSAGDVFMVSFKPITTTNTTTRFGFIDTVTYADNTDGVYFEIVGTTLSGKSSNASTRTSTGTTTTLVANTWYTAIIVVNYAYDRVDFYFYSDAGALFWTNSVTTNLPSSTNVCGYGFISTNSGTSSVVLTYIDWIKLGKIVRW